MNIIEVHCCLHSPALHQTQYVIRHQQKSTNQQEELQGAATAARGILYVAQVARALQKTSGVILSLVHGIWWDQGQHKHARQA